LSDEESARWKNELPHDIERNYQTQEETMKLENDVDPLGAK
jgi:hypothetical protein